MRQRGRIRRFALIGVAAAALQSAAEPPQPADRAAGPDRRLILLGGAPRPKAVWLAFSALAGGDQARGLILPWASGDPDGVFAAIKKEMDGIRPPTFFEMAAPGPLDAAAKRQVLDQIARTNGILILGGDQNRFLDVAQDPEIKAAIKARYEAGVVVAANDGGAITVGAIAVTGEEDPTIVDGTQVGNRPGLGLLPRAIFDTQFVRRQRYNRMLGMLLVNPQHVAVGIGSGTALVLRNNCEGEVIGGAQAGTSIVVAMKTLEAVTEERPGRVEMVLLRPGNKFDCSFFAPRP